MRGQPGGEFRERAMRYSLGLAVLLGSVWLMAGAAMAEDAVVEPPKAPASAKPANNALPVDTLPEDIKAVPRAERIDPIVAPVKRVAPKTPSAVVTAPKTLKAGVAEGTTKAKPADKTAAKAAKSKKVAAE